MNAVEAYPAQRELDRPWRLQWLTPWRCRLILGLVLGLGFLSHLRYLTHDCPIDLSGDEAHYWDWSRQLDWSYYSKGPLVAYIIRASCALLGDTMPAVRLPALILGVASSILTYWLARRLFQSDRIALGAVLLNHMVPMFVAGSVMMTIDPPFFFCWAAATCLAAKAVLDERRWAWVGLGLVIGVGFLAKYSMFLWLPGLLLFLATDPTGRRYLRTPWPWISIAIALLFTIPVIRWNAHHGWVSMRHVARQTGTSEGYFALGNPAEFAGGQLVALGPALVVILVGAVLYAAGGRGRGDAHARSLRFLLWMGLPFFSIVAVWSVRTKIQANWPAPAYFSLMILAAYFLSTRLASVLSWRPWRGWFWATVILGTITTPILHNLEILYHPVDRAGRLLMRKPSHSWTPQKWDPTYKLRGWKELGGYMSQQQTRLSPGAFVMAERYDAAAEMAFYMDGQPRTYYVGSWFADPQRRARLSQYDMWEDRRLDRPDLFGKDAVFLGYEPPEDLLAAFDRIEQAGDFEIVRRGLTVRTFHVWRCYGFKGMRRPTGEGKH